MDATTNLTAEQLVFAGDALGILSACFSLPTEALVEEISSGRLRDSFNQIAIGLGLRAGRTIQLEDHEGAKNDELLRTLRTEYTRLFTGAPTPAVWPYEGTRRAIANGGEPLLFVDRATSEVEESYAEAGFSRNPPDHAATELEFLSKLAYGASEGSDEANRLFRRFLQGHAAFLREFAEETSGKTDDPFYRAASELLADVMTNALDLEMQPARQKGQA